MYATGREAGLYATSSSPWTEAHIPTGGSGNAATDAHGYSRTYTYDKLGNMLDLYHYGNSGANAFHRYFNDWNNVGAAAYETSNLATEINYGGTTVSYAFDANGNRLSEGGGRALSR